MAVDFLGEGGALLKFQVLDLVVVVVHLAHPELGPLVVGHVGFAVGDGNPNVHVFSGHNAPSIFISGS